MSHEDDIPVLTDLVDDDHEITMSDLGLDGDSTTAESRLDRTNLTDLTSLTDPFLKAALEQSIRRILDEHLELAMQEIKLVIQHELDKKFKSSSPGN